MEHTIIVLLSGGWDYSLNSVLIIPLVKNNTSGLYHNSHYSVINTSGFTPFFPKKYQPILHPDEGRLAPQESLLAAV
jgi:hypothetical protein